jgi:hypothetical protein
MAQVLDMNFVNTPQTRLELKVAKTPTMFPEKNELDQPFARITHALKEFVQDR